MKINKYRLGSWGIMGTIYGLFFAGLAWMNWTIAQMPIWKTALIFFGSMIVMTLILKAISFAAHLSVKADFAQDDDDPCADCDMKEDCDLLKDGKVPSFEEFEKEMDKARDEAHKNGSAGLEVSISPDGIKIKHLNSSEVKTKRAELEKNPRAKKIVERTFTVKRKATKKTTKK